LMLALPHHVDALKRTHPENTLLPTPPWPPPKPSTLPPLQATTASPSRKLRHIDSVNDNDSDLSTPRSLQKNNNGDGTTSNGGGGEPAAAAVAAAATSAATSAATTPATAATAAESVMVVERGVLLPCLKGPTLAISTTAAKGWVMDYPVATVLDSFHAPTPIDESLAQATTAAEVQTTAETSQLESSSSSGDLSDMSVSSNVIRLLARRDAEALPPPSAPDPYGFGKEVDIYNETTNTKNIVCSLSNFFWVDLEETPALFSVACLLLHFFPLASFKYEFFLSRPLA
jgi:hypothetical protein